MLIPIGVGYANMDCRVALTGDVSASGEQKRK
jgi:hypothetical protein